MNTLNKLRNLPTLQFLSIVLIIAGTLRLINITKSSIWHDEGYTMMMLSFSPLEILHRTGLDVHPPLYYLLAKMWVAIFGTSVFAVRSLSVIFGLGVVIFTFLLVRRLFSESTARIAALFTALGPFLVRYSQEARMYGLLALIAAASTYLLIRAHQTNKLRDWVLYSATISLGLYTYYYVIFLIMFHWAYVAFLAIYPKVSTKNIKNTLLNPFWIGANAIAVGLFLPWLPTAYKQFTSVQTAFWIPKVNGDTIPVTFAQFFTFTDMNIIGGVPFGLLPSLSGRTLIFATFICLVGFAAFNLRKTKLKGVVLLSLFMGLTPIAVFGISLIKNPVYVDRYFVFASIAFYALLAVIVYHSKPWMSNTKLRQSAIAVLSLVLLYGVYNVYAQAGHRMAVVAAKIQQQFIPGDEIINGDFYTYFDYRYYNKTGEPNRAFVPDGFPGCCEGKSMLYDKPELQIKDLSSLRPQSGYVWIVGKTGEQDYFTTRIPDTWQPAGEKIEAGYSAAQRYRVLLAN